MSLAEFFRGMLGNVFFAWSRIDIDSETADHLVLDVNGRKILFNRLSRTVSSPGQMIARFDAILSIDLDHRSQDTRNAHWVIRLHLAEGNVTIGSLVDGVQASIVAAHISTITGKTVRPLPTTGHSRNF